MTNFKTTKNYPIVRISKVRILVFSSLLILGGIFCVVCCFYLLIYIEKKDTMSNTVSILMSFVSLYSIYLGFKCLFLSRIQLEFTDLGIKYRDVTKLITGKRPSGLSFGFYFLNKFLLLEYKDIKDVKFQKDLWSGSNFCLTTKTDRKILLPILVDSEKDAIEIVNLINEKLEQKTTANC